MKGRLLFYCILVAEPERVQNEWRLHVASIQTPNARLLITRIGNVHIITPGTTWRSIPAV